MGVSFKAFFLLKLYKGKKIDNLHDMASPSIHTTL